MDSPQPRGAHLVGSVPLEDAETVFRTVSAALGSRVRRIPDGETGVRTNWIRWQEPVFDGNPQLELREAPTADLYQRPIPRRVIREGVGDSLTFGPLGYAAAAIASYATFARLQEAGVIPAGCRFQVCLPTPLAPVNSFIEPGTRAAVEPAYEARMLAEVAEICAAIPHDRLAIQWDTALEFAMLEGVIPPYFENPEQGVIDRLVRLGESVPSDVELGFHLCYGDAGHRHFKEPTDTARLRDVANGVFAGIGRTVQWLHLPVPRERNDVAYFAPLAGLSLPSETELYLGLVHRTDGAEGARQRIAAAQQVVSAFGVGTECGLGRRPPESVAELFGIHQAVSAPLA